MRRKMPGQPFMNYLSVHSIEVYCRKVEKAGGTVVLPKTEIAPGMGGIAAFKYTECNIMGFHENPPKPPVQKARKKSSSEKGKSAGRTKK